MGKKEASVEREEFKIGDRIFAKLKGYPYWPAKIVEIEGNSVASKIKYQVKFYGTYETTFLKADSLLHFNEDSLKKHGDNRKLKTFNHGMWEIVNDPDLKLLEEENENDDNVEEEEDVADDASEQGDGEKESDQENNLVDIEKQSSSESSKLDAVKIKKKSKKSQSVEKKKSSKKDKKSPKKKKQKKEAKERTSKHKKSKKKKRSSSDTELIDEDQDTRDTNMSEANSVINSVSATSSSDHNIKSDGHSKPKRHKKDSQERDRSSSPSKKTKTEDDEKKKSKKEKKAAKESKKASKKRVISESDDSDHSEEPSNKVRRTEEHESKSKRADKDMKSPNKHKTDKGIVPSPAKSKPELPDIKQILQSISKESKAKRVQELKERWPVLSDTEREEEIKKMKELKVLEKKVAKLKSIRVQFALVRMDMEIKKSLKLDNTDVNRCCMILEDLLKLPIVQKQLFNAPEIVETIKKCRKFQASERVKKMASECFAKFTQMYPSSTGEAFSVVFEKERNKYMSEHEEEIKHERDLAVKMLAKKPIKH